MESLDSSETRWIVNITREQLYRKMKGDICYETKISGQGDSGGAQVAVANAD